MRAFIHSLSGRPWNEECLSARRGFGRLGVECVPFSDNETLESASREDVVVAGMLVTGHALTLRDVVPPSIDYPGELGHLLGRRVWSCVACEVSEDDLPVFVKPAREKELDGAVVRSADDLAPFLRQGADYELLCSEVVDFVSEWRLFVCHGELVGARPYRGDVNVRPDERVVRDVVPSYRSAPAGCAIDLGVTSDGRTLLVEVNDGFALGSYGLDDVTYALLLSARWAGLVGTEDPLRGRPVPGMVWLPASPTRRGAC